MLAQTVSSVEIASGVFFVIMYWCICKLSEVTTCHLQLNRYYDKQVSTILGEKKNEN
jgi:hypothetical protein